MQPQLVRPVLLVLVHGNTSQDIVVGVRACVRVWGILSVQESSRHPFIAYVLIAAIRLKPAASPTETDAPFVLQLVK